MDDDHRTKSADGPQDGGPRDDERRNPGPRAGAAGRALAEAEERRAAMKRAQHARPREINGRQGPEPVRYGDWENKGIAYDF